MTTYSSDPSELKRQIEQEAYAAWEEHSGQRLGRNPDGSFRSQGHNNALDAFRHAYTSGRASQIAPAFGDTASQYFGDRNEIGPAHLNDPYEHRMDLWNNEVGRRIAEDTSDPAELARRAYAAIRDGTAVTGLGDARLRQLFPDDPRLALPEGSRERDLLTGDDVRRINRDVERALDRRQAAAFPEGHPDRAMFDRIRAGAPAGASDEKIAEVMLAARRDGIDNAAAIRDVHVHEGRLIVEGRTPGFQGVAALAAAPPAMAQTVEALDRHRYEEASTDRQRQQALEPQSYSYGR